MVNLLEHSGIQKFLYDNNLEVHFDVVRDEEKLPRMWRCWFYHSKLMRPHLMYDDGVMVGNYGRGNTTMEAFNDLCSKLSGKLLIFDTASERERIQFPIIIRELTYEEKQQLRNNVIGENR